MMSRIGNAAAAANGRLLDCRQVAIEKNVSMMKMRSEIDAANLTAALQARDQERYSDGAAEVAHEVAHPGNLVIVFPPHTDVRQRANGNKDQRQADDLEHAHPNDA